MTIQNTGLPLHASTAEAMPAQFMVLCHRFVSNLPEFLLISIELWMTILSAIWATGTLLHLGQHGFWLLAVPFCVPGVWAMAQLARLAIQPTAVETDADLIDPAHS